MKTIVKLSDFDNDTIRTCLNSFNSYTTYGRYIEQAIKHQKDKDLRYNVKAGKTYNNDGFVSSFVSYRDIPDNPSNFDVIAWQFGGVILNSAGRLHRGYSA